MSPNYNFSVVEWPTEYRNRGISKQASAVMAKAVKEAKRGLSRNMER